MKKIFCSLIVMASVIISSVCFAATAEEMRYFRQYSYDEGVLGGVAQAIFELIEKDDIARLEKVGNNVNNSPVVLGALKSLGNAGRETGNGVTPAVFTAFKNTWRCKYNLMKPLMEKVILAEGPIKKWSSEEKSAYRKMMQEANVAEEKYRAEMINVGIRP